MGAQENEELVRRGFAPFGAGDMATLTELFADDAAWHEIGAGGVSGIKEGRDAVFAHFGEEFQRSGGTFAVEHRDVVAGETHAVARAHEHAEHEGKVLNQDGVLVLHIQDGRVVRAWEIPDDQVGRADFFS